MLRKYNKFLVDMKILLLFTVISNRFGFIYMQHDIKTNILSRIECSFGNNECDCPVDGQWSNWGSWSPCTGECGQVGLRQRYRKCNNPSPLFGGETCHGSAREANECRMTGCTEEEFKALTKCDPIRYAEFKFLQSVHHKDPALSERCLSSECHYTLVKNILELQADRYWNALHCVKHNNGCPVPGGWSIWGKWSECSANYGVGKRIRCRTCDSPKPTYPIFVCKGLNCSTEICHGSNIKQPKRGVWGLWSPWSKCTTSCGQGLRKRIRFCVNERDLTTPFHIEGNFATCRNCPPWLKSKYCQISRTRRNAVEHSFCSGPHTEIEPCYLKSCAVNGEWSEWEPWSQCSTACGIGVQSRSRACSSPPPSGGGAMCCGPYTWLKHCYLGPCQVADRDVVAFSGNGALYYRKTNQPTRVLHMYVKVKPFALNGDIIFRTSVSNLHPELGSKIRLSLAAGYVVFTASLGRCYLTVVSHRTVKMKKWLRVLVMLTGYGVTLRIDDNEKYYKEPFSCNPRLPNLDGEMIVGGNFSGQLQKLYVNFLRREIKSSPQPVSEDKYIFPSSITNVIYENCDSDDARSLEDLILIPCGSKSKLSVELVVKTSSHDGLLMLIKHFYGTRYLLVSFEPRRVLLQLLLNDCVYECFEILEAHVNQWTYITVDFNSEQNWGLSVNGGMRKVIKNYEENMIISCEDYIMVGDVEDVINRSEDKNVLIMGGINIRSISGVLSYVKVNNIILDVASLPGINVKGETLFSSEQISYSKHYDEIELIYGQQLNLTCFYSLYTWKGKKFYSSIYGNDNEPLWIKLDTPLTPNDTHLMKNIGIVYKIIDDGEITVLTTVQYSSRDAIEGVYSCWIPNPINDSNIIITYGVTVIDRKTEFLSFSTFILNIVTLLFLMLYATTMIWLLFECEESYRIWIGIFTTTSIVKQLRKMEICETSHNHNSKHILGVKNKVEKGDAIFLGGSLGSIKQLNTK